MPVKPQNKLPDGREIPIIGFGTYLIPPTETFDAVYSALKSGYRLIDTAAVYYNELQTAEAIGKFLNDNKGTIAREDIIYTSKLWESDFGESAAQGIQESIENAADIGKIDLYLLHSPKGGKEGRRKAWAALEKSVEDGKIGAIGVSNWSDKHLRELVESTDLKIKPAVNQIEINPWLQQNDIVDYCNENGIAVEAYSPLTLGIKLEDPTVVKLAEKYKKTPAQILLRWDIERGIIPLPKSIKLDRIVENYGACEFTIDQRDIKELGDPTQRFVTVPDWDPCTWE